MQKGISDHVISYRTCKLHSLPIYFDDGQYSTALEQACNETNPDDLSLSNIYQHFKFREASLLYVSLAF